MLLPMAAIILAIAPTGTDAFAGSAASQERRPQAMTDRHLATGTFDVTLTPTSEADAAIGSMAIAKTFHGDLEASSVGQMLAVRTAVANSAGYVAMERVTGRLAGRSGSFALQHSGTMDRGASSLSVAVVPDSGTGELSGISGEMEIRVDGGRHDYVFRYTLPQSEPAGTPR